MFTSPRRRICEPVLVPARPIRHADSLHLFYRIKRCKCKILHVSLIRDGMKVSGGPPGILQVGNCTAALLHLGMADLEVVVASHDGKCSQHISIYRSIYRYVCDTPRLHLPITLSQFGGVIHLKGSKGI